MSQAYTCTIATDGGRRFYRDGTRISKQTMHQEYPSFDQDTNCLKTAQRARLMKRFHKRNVNLLTDAYIDALQSESIKSLATSTEQCALLQSDINVLQANAAIAAQDADQLRQKVQILMNENLKLATSIKEMRVAQQREHRENRVEETQDECLLSEDNARACIQKIRSKFQSLAGLLVDDKGALDALLTTNGQLYVVPASYNLQLNDALTKNIVPIKLVDGSTGSVTTTNAILVQPKSDYSSKDTFITVVTKDMKELSDTDVNAIKPMLK
jgi:hypothetical protein